MYTGKFGDVYAGDYFYSKSDKDKINGFYVTELYIKDGCVKANGTWTDGGKFVNSNVAHWSGYTKVSMKETRIKKLLKAIDES